jgi:hypothetical protein
VNEIQMARFQEPNTPSRSVEEENIGNNEQVHPVATASEVCEI